METQNLISYIFFSSVVLLIVGLSHLFALFESCILSTDELKLFDLLKSSKKTSKKYLKKIFESRSKTLVMVTSMNTFVGIVGSLLLGSMSARIFDASHVWWFTFCYAYILLVISKILPKTMASRVYKSVLRRYAKFIYFLRIALHPFLFFTYPIVASFESKNSKPKIKDLKRVVDYYEDTGVISLEEEKMLTSLLDKKATKISDIVDAEEAFELIGADLEIRNLISLLVKSAGRKFIVIDSDRSVKGIAYHGDLANAYMKKDRDLLVSELTREAGIIDIEKTVLDGLLEMRKVKVGRLIVLREGEPLGIVTLKQLYKHLLTAD